MIKTNALILFFATILLQFCPSSPESKGFEEISNFGNNPGGLKGFLYTPENATANAPLVVVLHGCLQDATEIARLSDWNELAEEHGFLVLYPQQKSLNNFNNCFNWFVPEDIHKGSGEALSIRQMVAYVAANNKIDENRIYVTGISAGGAMAAVMLATYPEVFRAGAVMAGIPYAAALDMPTGFKAMRGEVVQSSEEWEAKVREQNQGFTGAYPTLAIFQGTDDPAVNFINADELVKQWAALFDINPNEPAEVKILETNAKVKRSTFKDSSGAPVLLRYDLDSLGHAIAVDPGDGPQQGGEEGQFAKDVDFFSSYWAAVFFGLVEE
ncbi:MAG: PHB depolymerase family esterase [Phaeodactylibacter sp.]|nr:PHB depolymerase family esterase [Phaeodactylibacter sp.]MCB9302159.1 PHB depolymerase family esterase [Lewinellaceae bacterium]